jgi:acyl-coenzyme A synthetase/AMP-(fatty) acid ligase
MQGTSAIVAYYQSQALDEAEFLQHVTRARSLLPPCLETGSQARLLNLCEDRYHFLVLFVAAMLQHYITVMPANQSSGELARLRKEMPGALLIGDAELEAICCTQEPQDTAVSVLDVLRGIAPDSVVAELYTSGSTGTPMANSKRWGELVHGAQRVAARFGLGRESQHTVVATVPPQHMFGFEMSIVLPLVCGVAVHHGKPFYPEDIRQALLAVPAKRMLVTTPLHLKACASLGSAWPSIDFILSATAVLPAEVAQAATDIMQAPVREIYGCSEIGAIATRTLLENSSWELLGDFRLQIGAEAKLTSSILAQPLVLPDQIAMDEDGRFSLVGRIADLIKIGGKRGSLSEITRHLRAIPGVIDAIVFVPERTSPRRLRLAALVVAPGLSAKAIRHYMAQHVDAVFVPRQIRLVAQLPYNPAGKLPYAELIAMLKHSQAKEQVC